MQFISISQKYADICKSDPEILFRENRRPHLLVLALRYKGKLYRFAVPLRSNISPHTPPEQYFALPPRKSTKPGYRHGIHYIKMFPLRKEHQEKFIVAPNSSYALYQTIVNSHEKEITDACQKYLDDYAAGVHPPYSVDIDKAIERLESL